MKLSCGILNDIISIVIVTDAPVEVKGLINYIQIARVSVLLKIV
ncbi:hypothetical protein [Desertivirga arenae]|nr:hypothetical protein [Pedobacter sp. SYSU D00823]